MTPEIERALEVFELQSARQVWGNLTVDEQAFMRRIAQYGEAWPKIEEVESANGPDTRINPDGTRFRYYQKSVDTPATTRLAELGLIQWTGAADSGPDCTWGMYRPRVHGPTPFGSVVARLGNALRIVELSAA